MTEPTVERRTPPTNKTSLAARLRNIARENELSESRLQRHLSVIVVAEMLGRARDEAGAAQFLIKGGSSVEMRLGISASRASKDLDAVFRGDFTRMYDRAREQLAEGWNGFTAEVMPAETIDVPGLLVKPRRFKVKLRYKGSNWGSVPVEVSPPEAGSAVESDVIRPVAMTNLPLRELGLDDAGTVECLPLRYQLAQKFHACTEVYADGNVNERAHDVIDILLLWRLVPATEHPDVHEACVEIFATRDKQTWPPTLSSPAIWTDLYAAEMDSLDCDTDLPATIGEATEAINAVVSVICASVAE